MGNRHGGDKPARDEQKEEKKKKRKEKKEKKGGKRGKGGKKDSDVDPELSSVASCADSASVVFHSAENLSPYLDASTRSQDFHDMSDSGHVLSSRDFQDGFSLEACLPADLAAAMSDSGEGGKHGDDSSTASGGGVGGGAYHTPLLSSAEVRRGLPPHRSPMAQRANKDSFLEPIPPLPSDVSSNTLSSQHSSGGRSSSRTSSSTVDTNAAHCIERLEELERNIERTIIERFAPMTASQHQALRHLDSDDEEDDDVWLDSDVSPRLQRRPLHPHAGGETRSREGSATPKGLGPGGLPSRSVESSPATGRKVCEPCRPTCREGSATPKGVVAGKFSQSAENSPVIVRKALPPESPVIVRRTPTQSPSVGRKLYPANASEISAVLLKHRQAHDGAPSPKASPNIPRRVPVGVGSPNITTTATKPSAHPTSPLAARRPAPEVPPREKKDGQCGAPPPVPPKYVTLDMVRRAENVPPKSPVMPRKVYAFQTDQQRQQHQQQQSRSLFGTKPLLGEFAPFCFLLVYST
jgi:hypothetical protein